METSLNHAQHRMQWITFWIGFSINLYLIVSITDSLLSPKRSGSHRADVSWVKDEKSSSRTLQIHCLAVDIQARVQMSQALLGLAGNCSRHEAFGFKSHQMPPLCPPIQQNQQMAGQQLASCGPDWPWSRKCPSIMCFSQHFVHLHGFAFASRSPSAWWHLPELTWNN